MANKQLSDFTANATPHVADIFYTGDSTNSFVQRKVTGSNIISNFNLPTISGTPVAGNLSVWATSTTEGDSGITVDHSQNLTNVGTINGVNISNALLKGNNLSDVSSVSTSRTNLGLGTAATKTASGAGSTVASVTGAFTVGHAAVFADTSGTIQDGGSTSGFLLAANNLSDVLSAATSRTNLGLGTAATHAATDFLLVANNLSDVASKTTSFNNVSPLTSKGDLIGFDGSNNVRVGNSTDGYVLTMRNSATAGWDWEPVPSPGDNIRVISTTTILTSADFGKTIVCEGSSAYTVTLPAASAGTNKFIYFIFDLPQQIFVTVAPAGVDIIVGPGSSAANAYIFGDGEYLQVMTDNSAWFPAASLQPCNMYGFFGNNFVSNSSLTGIICSSTTKSNIGYNGSNGYIIPIYPGKYRFSIQITAPTNLTAYTQQVGANVIGTGYIYSFDNVVANNSASQSIMCEFVENFSGLGSAGNPGSFLPVYANSGSLTITGNNSINFLTVERISNF